MGLIDIASNNSTWRGLDYYKENRVINYSKINDNQYEGIVSNSNGKEYDVFWIVNPFLNNFYKDTFLYSIGVK